MNAQGLVDMDSNKVVISGSSTGRKSRVGLGWPLSQAKHSINVRLLGLFGKSFPVGD